MAKVRLSELPSELSEGALRVFSEVGGYAEEGTAFCVFCRPTDEQLACFERGEEPDPAQNYFEGRNIFSILWGGVGVRDQIRLARKLCATVGEGGVFATHTGAEFQKWNPPSHSGRSLRCQ